MVRVRARARDDTSWLRPKSHIWTRSKQPWVTLPQGDEIFAAQPVGSDRLSASVGANPTSGWPAAMLIASASVFAWDPWANEFYKEAWGFAESHPCSGE
jgi:hypothetical protein